MVALRSPLFVIQEVIFHRTSESELKVPQSIFQNHHRLWWGTLEKKLRAQSHLDAQKAHFFQLSFESMKRSMTQEPWIQSVRFQRHFPDVLRCFVVYRTPVAILQKTPQFLVYINQKGQVLGSIQEVWVGEGLPILTGFKENQEEILQAVLKLVVAWQELGLDKKAPLAELHWESKKGLKLLLLKPARTWVEVGFLEGLEEKMAKFSLFLGYWERHALSFRSISLELPKKIVVKLPKPA